MELRRRPEIHLGTHSLRNRPICGCRRDHIAKITTARTIRRARPGGTPAAISHWYRLPASLPPCLPAKNIFTKCLNSAEYVRTSADKRRNLCPAGRWKDSVGAREGGTEAILHDLAAAVGRAASLDRNPIHRTVANNR